VLRIYRGWKTRKCESYGAEKEDESESRKNAKETAKRKEIKKIEVEN